MTATSQPTLDTLPDMHNVAAIIAQDARDNQAGVDVISVGPVYGEQVDHGLQYSVMVIVPSRDADNFAASHIMLDIAQDPFMANAYRIASLSTTERCKWRQRKPRLRRRLAHRSRLLRDR